MNILIHGVDEEMETVWETHQQTMDKFNNFLKNALDIDHSQIAVADLHRLPQKPVFRQGQKVTRPIIVKLVYANDKNYIYRQLRKLKSYNETRKINSKSNIYITDHLPAAFLEQKKS